MLGYLEQAQAASARALDLSERLGHKPSIAHTNLFRAELCIILDRPEEAESAPGDVPIAVEEVLARRLPECGGFERGVGPGSARRYRRGLAADRRGPELLKSVPSRRFHLPIRIAIVGRTKAAANDVEGALALFDAALEAAATTGETLVRSGAVPLQSRDAAGQEPPGCARRGRMPPDRCSRLRKARRQRFWEMRAATALAKLWDAKVAGPRRTPSWPPSWLVHGGPRHSGYLKEARAHAGRPEPVDVLRAVAERGMSGPRPARRMSRRRRPDRSAEASGHRQAAQQCPDARRRLEAAGEALLAVR
jgi:hypothetical protein